VIFILAPHIHLPTVEKELRLIKELIITHYPIQLAFRIPPYFLTPKINTRTNPLPTHSRNSRHFLK
jgi:hypothetical protein